ncbi:ImmA/IrrE family metallo-endopeptidase [Bradyrhizobium sp. sBnM-33]|uniref:ImmA/IrrE family metallo-endopeptidase n=1 Tax=Bradyrhizobium sp. sBnM-33 TaxID=2831780 RepID=UPI001BCE17BB|nr:ImmA/IrrE family metallo-endopeptidase [Bradyrhizobium sp. sBnM-33]WOH52623.1 ImmA/IrrE family metallo-endopeptidase [Bradyrhizobium sp. sBnM-33]
MRRFCRLLTLVFVLQFCSGLHAQTGTPNPIDAIRNAQDYQFLSSLFPQAGAKFDPDRDQVMTSDQQRDASAFLTSQFNVQKEMLNKQLASVMRSLERIGVRPIAAISEAPTTIEFRDDQNAWSTTVSPTRIIIGARLLRGLVLGSLREAVEGKALFSKSLASYLGSTPGAALELADLEARARLFFAAARNGISMMRTEADFREHYETVLALMKGYLKGGTPPEETYDALRTRLAAAAAGGEISGADGMAMFDVFMRLGSHFNPAMMFVLSHELGHVVLGHSPFPTGMTCAESQRREDDADAFAIALLSYDIPGETEATDRALARVNREKENASADRNSLAYGYVQAIQYGFALAGLSNLIDQQCSYRDVADRIAYLDHLRENFVASRTDAIEEIFRHFKSHPPYVHTSSDVESLTSAKKRKLAQNLFKLCGVAQGPKVHRLKKVKELPFGWVVECPNALPSRFRLPQFRARLGTHTWQEIELEYRNHLPGSSLMDENVIKSLLQP